MADAAGAKEAVHVPEPAEARPSRIRNFDPLKPPTDKPQEYYDDIKKKFAEERDVRLGYRPEGKAQFITDLGTDADLANYEIDPFAEPLAERAPINDTVEVLCIGGGFSALLTAARLRERGVESIRIVERGADVGGTWYWNRYPGIACDTPSYDYLPLLDEMGKVPPSYLRQGPGDLRALPGDRQEVRPLQAGGVPDHGDLHRLGREGQALDHQHRSRRQDVGALRDLRQRHAVAAEAVQDRRHGDASRATPSTPRASTTTTPGRTCRS